MILSRRIDLIRDCAGEIHLPGRFRKAWQPARLCPFHGLRLWRRRGARSPASVYRRSCRRPRQARTPPPVEKSYSASPRSKRSRQSGNSVPRQFVGKRFFSTLGSRTGHGRQTVKLLLLDADCFSTSPPCLPHHAPASAERTQASQGVESQEELPFDPLKRTVITRGPNFR
jgi:hypothetical protein